MVQVLGLAIGVNVVRRLAGRQGVRLGLSWTSGAALPLLCHRVSIAEGQAVKAVGMRVCVEVHGTGGPLANRTMTTRRGQATTDHRRTGQQEARKECMQVVPSQRRRSLQQEGISMNHRVGSVAAAMWSIQGWAVWCGRYEAGPSHSLHANTAVPLLTLGLGANTASSLPDTRRSHLHCCAPASEFLNTFNRGTLGSFALAFTDYLQVCSIDHRDMYSGVAFDT